MFTLTIVDSVSTIYTENTVTDEITEDIITTEAETLEIFQDTTCIEDIVTGKSTKTIPIDEPTNRVTVTTPAHTNIVTVKTDIFTPTESDSIFSVIEMKTVTRKFKPVIRIATDYNSNLDTCGTFIVADK